MDHVHHLSMDVQIQQHLIMIQVPTQMMIHVLLFPLVVQMIQCGTTMKTQIRMMVHV